LNIYKLLTLHFCQALLLVPEGRFFQPQLVRYKLAENNISYEQAVLAPNITPLNTAHQTKQQQQQQRLTMRFLPGTGAAGAVALAAVAAVAATGAGEGLGGGSSSTYTPAEERAQQAAAAAWFELS
jgi:hypothetical protein